MPRTTLISALLALSMAGCDGTLGGGEDWGEGAHEPEDGSEYGIFTTGLAAGTVVKVCKTGGSKLNMRSGAGTGYKIIAQLDEGEELTILAAKGSWYKLDAGGWSYHYYLCETGSSSSSGSTSEPGGSAGTCGSFQHPAPGYPVTSEFGECRDGCTRYHQGIDLGLPKGTSVRAAMGGVVEFEGWMSGYGYTVDINHCGKYTTRYAHLSSYVAGQGAKVSGGQTVARSGNSGVGTGPHLHFEIRLGGRWGKAVNPRNYVAF